MKFTKNYFQNVAKIANTINIKEINNLVIEINKIKKIRMSLDMRFILSTNLAKNPIQSATGKKFFLRKLF